MRGSIFCWRGSEKIHPHLVNKLGLEAEADQSIKEYINQ